MQIDYNDQTVIVKPSLFDMETYIQITKHYQALCGLINRAEEIGQIIEDDDLEMEMLTSLLYYEQLWANEAMILLNVNPNEMIINQIENDAGNEDNYIQVWITLEERVIYTNQ